MTRYQKVNHWPKTTEMTRKDNMYKHLAQMRAKHGAKHFDFVPESFVLPHEAADCMDAMIKNPEKYWIAKPSSSS
jgi:tubulin polyglutamylase TTLL5